MAKCIFGENPEHTKIANYFNPLVSGACVGEFFIFILTKITTHYSEQVPVDRNSVAKVFMGYSEMQCLGKLASSW